MLTLAAADTLAAGGSVASQLTSTVFGMELTAGPTETYKVLDQRQLASSPATIYTVAGSTTAFVKTISVVNNDSSARTAQYFRGGTAAANAISPALAIPAGGMALYEDGTGWTVYDANGAIQNQVSPSIGFPMVTALAADVSNSTTTVAAVAGLDMTLPIGTYSYDYMIRYVSVATTTGVKFAVDHTGTVGWTVYKMLGVDTSATAATAAMSQAANAATGQVHAAWSSRADNTTLGPTISSDTTGDMLMKIEGILNVTASGTLRLMHGSEVAAQTTVKAGSNLSVLKVA